MKRSVLTGFGVAMAVALVTTFGSPPTFAHQEHRATTTTAPTTTTPEPPTTTTRAPVAPTDDAHVDEPGARPGEIPGEPETTGLSVSAPKSARLGDTVRFQATLHDDTGKPVEDALITFMSPAQWGREFSGEMELGTARTNAEGQAFLDVAMRRSGDVEVHAAFAGDDGL